MNIWKLWDEGYYIVIPTNIGWKRNGLAVMGAGLASQARDRFPGIDLEYGRWVQKYLGDPMVDPTRRLILIPSKDLNPIEPHMSWKQPASLTLVKKAYAWLYSWAMAHPERRVATVYLGIGLGQLKFSDVYEAVQKYNWPPNVVFVGPSVK
jgi:hypothetical protein